MLSALAKYIFGGVMGDAPETTPMQYETREMNDWLLVDMPDQAIDDEDMDSESDDEDDILSAVPLLMDEEALPYSQQIVLSYEANSVCDNTYNKTRKDFRDKIHSAKVQIHSGDKTQGNFLKNIETLSVETEGTSQIKANNNSTKLQGNSKSKRSKSKKCKSTKRFRKNKIQEIKEDKIKDIPAAAKENTDKVQANSNDVQKDFNKTTQSVRSKIPDSSVNNVNKIEDSVVPMQENSIDAFIDVDTEFYDNNKVQEHFPKTQQEINNEVKSDFSSIKSSCNVTMVNTVALALSSESRNPSTTDNIQVQNLLDCNDGMQTPLDDQVMFGEEAQRNPSELKENSSKSKKLRSKPKRFRKNKIQNNKDVKVIKEIHIAANKSSDNVQGISHDAQKDLNKTPQFVKCQILDSSINDNKISDLSKTDVSPVPVLENSTDTIKDIDAMFHDKSKQDIGNEVKSDFSEIKESNIEIKTISEGVNVEVPIKLELNSKNLPAATDVQIQNPLSNDKIQNSSDDQVIFEGNIQCNSLELKGNSSKSKKLGSKKSRKSKTHHKFNKKTQSNVEVAQGDCSVQENANNADNNTQVIPPEVLNKLYDESNVECRHEAMDVCVTEDEESDAFLKDIMENFYECQENIDKKMFFTSSEMQYNLIDQDILLNNQIVSEMNFTSSTDDLLKNGLAEARDMLENNNCELSGKSAEISESTNSISNEGHNNSTQDKVDQEQLQSKIQDVCSNDISNDSDLEDFLDIYTKFHEDFDVVLKISDEEIEKVFVKIQASDNEMDESSDNEAYSASDDEMSEDSYFNAAERRFIQLADSGHGAKILQIVAQQQEESDEESDDYAYLSTKSDTFNSAVNWPVNHFYFNRVPRTQKILLTYNNPQTFELTESFNFEPEHSFACQSLYYPSSYAIAIAQLNPELYQCHKECQHCSPRNNATMQKHKKRMAPKKQASNNATADPTVIINTELQNFINQLKPTVSVLPTKSAVVLEHVKELKPVQQAIQFEARKYLTRSQLNRQNRNYIYQSSVKTNRRRNLQRNPSGANNNRKCY